MKDYYEILEVNPKASKYIIEKVYRIQVKKFHPDLHQDEQKKKECELKIKEINEAYEILSDDEKRKKYDIEYEKGKINQELYYNIAKENSFYKEENAKLKEYIEKNTIKSKLYYKPLNKKDQNNVNNIEKKGKSKQNNIFSEFLKSIVALILTAAIIISLLLIINNIQPLKDFILKQIFI